MGLPVMRTLRMPLLPMSIGMTRIGNVESEATDLIRRSELLLTEKLQFIAKYLSLKFIKGKILLTLYKEESCDE